jgi:predicted RNA-binding Zn-ribbon protein involved in translation (DUF1610 family)
MWSSSVGFLVIAAAMSIFVVGLRAARTRTMAMLGMVPAGCAMGAFTWLAVYTEVDVVVRIAQCLAALAVGFAHAVAFSLVALPARRVWMRLVFVPVGLWTGTFAALWLAWPFESVSLRILLGLLGGITITAWVMLPFYSKNRGFVERGKKKLPSVRFPCPRCGTRVDWAQGVGSCTDCGLFMHLHWPADERQTQHPDPSPAASPARPARAVKFACPSCGETSEWPRGDNTCPSCGMKISIHWNVHTKAP